jgi:site-specific recombinase XerD
MAIVRKAGYKAITKTFHESTPLKSKKAAEAWSHQTEANLTVGRTSAHIEVVKRTVGQLVAEYRRLHEPTLKAGSRSGFNVALDYLNAHIGGMKLANVTPATITELQNKALSEPAMRHNQKTAGSTRSTRTVRRYATIWGSAFRFATFQLKWLPVDSNPFMGLRRIKMDTKPPRYLSDQERAALLKETAKHADLHDAVMVSLLTGARQQEILGLRVKDVGLQSITIVSAKVEWTRELPVTEGCIAILHKRAEGKAAGDLLWPAHRSGSSKPLSLRKPFAEALKAAGITKFRWHDLRHSAASMLVQSNVSLQHVGQLLGHKQQQTTAIYAHLSNATLAATLGKLGNLMEGV